ncbi:MAG TPA: hypothetical protein VF904_09520 [Anaeromyxobacteraceae bacterium]
MNARTALRALAVLLPLAARADSLSFTYSASIYQDAKEVALRSPEGVACTGGSLVVADTGNRRLLTFALKESGIISQTGEVKLGQLTSPVKLQVDGKGNLLALDGKSHKIVRVDANGGFGGFVELKGAPATPMILGFKLDAADNLYALDVASGKVLVADLAGSVIRAVDLPKGPVISDIAADGGGTIYAVDGVGATVWSAAKGATAFTQLGKSLKDRMSFPSYIVAHQGKLILVDQNGMGLVLLGLDGSYLGRQLAIGWNDGFVYYPSQLCINEKGDSFVADRGNNRVQQFTTAR